ncbi:hypothetical protein NQ318_014560 [Aromia moschata]|uniref:Uncharacterized protein n=1 Tax=Aromia moschata TaxID=1265417 RepID=A0AAV8XYJ3_9CUCU|nr:hypothetical protein NQ318_014560 [Aromia moschata]
MVIGRKRGFEGDGRLGVCRVQFMHPQERFLRHPMHLDLLKTPYTPVNRARKGMKQSQVILTTAKYLFVEAPPKIDCHQFNLSYFLFKFF